MTLSKKKAASKCGWETGPPSSINRCLFLLSVFVCVASFWIGPAGTIFQKRQQGFGEYLDFLFSTLPLLLPFRLVKTLLFSSFLLSSLLLSVLPSHFPLSFILLYFIQIIFCFRPSVFFLAWLKHMWCFYSFCCFTVKLFVFPAVGRWLTVCRTLVSWSGTSVWSVRPALLPLLFLPPFLFLSLPRSRTTRHLKKERSPASWLREWALPLSCRPREVRRGERRGEREKEGIKRRAERQRHTCICCGSVLQPRGKWESGRETGRVCQSERRERKRGDVRQPCPWELHHNSLKRAGRRCE